MFSRAMIRAPTAAWIGTSNCCRGMSSLSFLGHHHAAVGPVASAWTIALEGVDRLAVEEDVDLDEIRDLVAVGFVVERRVALVRDFNWSKKSNTISASGGCAISTRSSER